MLIGKINHTIYKYFSTESLKNETYLSCLLEHKNLPNNLTKAQLNTQNVESNLLSKNKIILSVHNVSNEVVLSSEPTVVIFNSIKYYECCAIIISKYFFEIKEYVLWFCNLFPFENELYALKQQQQLSLFILTKSYEFGRA
jgi:hypothetical protein